jgi:hypothetical protein
MATARGDRRALLRPEEQKVPSDFRTEVAECLRRGLRLPAERTYREAWQELNNSGELRWRVHGSPDGDVVLPFELNVHAPGGMTASGIRLRNFRATLKYGELKQRHGPGGLACIARFDGDHNCWHVHPFAESGGHVCDTGATERAKITMMTSFNPSGSSDLLAASLLLFTDWNFRDEQSLQPRLSDAGFPVGAVPLVV